MPRPRTTDPKKYQRPDGWQVKIAGRTYRLGRDEMAAESRRRQLVAAWLAAGGPGESLPPIGVDHEPATMMQALKEYAERGLRPNLDQRQRKRIALTIRALADRFGTIQADEFGGRHLKQLRASLIEKGLARGYINSLVGCVKTAWGWMASERLVPANRLIELRAVRSLEEGDGGRETPAILPPDPASVAAALAEMSPAVAAMVRLQLCTGMRPGEVFVMRSCDISTRPDEILHPPNGLPTSAVVADGVLIWAYAPIQHKTRRRGKTRLIALDPECQRILRPFLLRAEPDAYLFRPIDAARGRRPRGHLPGERYNACTYGVAVRRACRRAARRWHPPMAGVPCAEWSPGSLRHQVATELYAADPTLAAAVLGHAPEMSRHYAATTFRRAAERAAKRGS